MVNKFNFEDGVMYKGSRYILEENIKMGSKKRLVKARKIFARFKLLNGKKEVVSRSLKIPIAEIKKKAIPSEFDDRNVSKRRTNTPVTPKEFRDIKRFAKLSKFTEFQKNFKVEPLSLGGQKHHDIFWTSGRWVTIIKGDNKEKVIKTLYLSLRK